MHRRFGHMGRDTISKLHDVTTHAAVPLPKEKHICKACQIGKMKQSINHTVAERKDKALDVVSVDTCGPFPTSARGFTYFINLVDNYSRLVWTLFTKDRKSTREALDKWKAEVELQSGHKIKAIRVDNAKEFNTVISDWGRSTAFYMRQLSHTHPTRMALPNGQFRRRRRQRGPYWKKQSSQ